LGLDNIQTELLCNLEISYSTYYRVMKQTIHRSSYYFNHRTYVYKSQKRDIRQKPKMFVSD